ncbi:hypothetical protein M9H77_21602 [Catharanthus roseus]|uniref:Uncharacterized protein n=1 Tax=Catharanthus roseus TaxID=4058 RepID=A0ACC0AQ47_CATRO|nr:hypothetical protein M9H77_21602 [Catharanthus roseus]
MLRLQDLRRSSCNRLSSSGNSCGTLQYITISPRTRRQLCKIYDVCSAQKIYDIVAKIKRNRMQGRNMVEEVLCLSAQRGYTVFHRNREESNVLTVGMTPTGKNFTVATTFMCNEQATTYRWVLQQIKHLYCTSAKSNGQSSIINEGEPLGLNISSVAFWGRDNKPHLALKKIMNELKKAREMDEEPGSNCLHYLRKSYGLPCACELVHGCQYLIPILEEDVDIFLRKLEIGSNIPEEHDRYMDFEMHDLTSLIQEISTGPICKVQEVRRLIKDVYLLC